MNDKNKVIKLEEEPTLWEVELSELQVIVGGQVGGHGGGEQISLHPVPGYPTPWLPRPPVDPVPLPGVGGK
jgi:hypothetical protein